MAKQPYVGQHRVSATAVLSAPKAMTWQAFEKIWKDLRRACRAFSKDLQRRQRRRAVIYI